MRRLGGGGGGVDGEDWSLGSSSLEGSGECDGEEDGDLGITREDWSVDGSIPGERKNLDDNK